MVTLGRRQDGVLDVGQLAVLGIGEKRLRGLVAEGRLRRLHRGVYADALAPLTPRAHLLAALLAVGPTAFLSHRTAAALHGLRPINLHAIEVTVVADHTPRRSGLIVRRTLDSPDPSELRSKDGLRVSSAALMLLQLAPRETPHELDRLIAEAARRKLLDLDQIDAALARRSCVPGARKLAAALQRYRPTPADRSGFERDFAAWLDTHPEIPTPIRNAHIDIWELDFLWPDHRLVVETDGDQYHRTPAELERDRVKDAWLQRHDFRVLRITGFRFAHDRSGILDDLLALTDSRRAA